MGIPHGPVAIGRGSVVTPPRNGFRVSARVRRLSDRSPALQERVDRRRDGVIERKLAHLAEVSLVTFGAYGEAAAITGVRDQTGTPNLDSLADILGKIKR